MKYDAACVDHQFNLLIEESNTVVPILVEALDKGHTFVVSLSRHPIARRELLKIQKEQGVKKPLCPIMGTKNRWASQHYHITRVDISDVAAAEAAV